MQAPVRTIGLDIANGTHTGGRTSAKRAWCCSSATFATTQRITICDGWAFPPPRRMVTPRCPRTGRHISTELTAVSSSGPRPQFIERGYRKTAEFYGIFE